jgi:membrane associated rhomboid family serine protease
MLSDRHYMREPSHRPQWSATGMLLVLNAVCFLLQNVLQSYGNFPVDHQFALSIEGLRHWKLYQLITFQFLHGGMWHLAGNLLAIYFFGRGMEDMLGRNGLLKLYFASGIFGGLCQIALGLMFPHYFGGGVLGASAGAFGLVAAFATRAPNQPLTMLLFFILPVTFPAKVLLFIQLAFTIFGILFPSGNIAHGAHLGGMIVGVAYIKWLTRSPSAVMLWRPFRRPPRRRELISTPQVKNSPWKRTVKTEDEDLPPAEFISKEVDPILDKISAHGIQSLTDRERQILEAARKKMAKR